MPNLLEVTANSALSARHGYPVAELLLSIFCSNLRGLYQYSVTIATVYLQHR
jgi:hypothetical protein